MSKIKKSLISIIGLVTILLFKATTVFADVASPVLRNETPSVPSEPSNFEKVLPIILIVGAITVIALLTAGAIALVIKKTSKQQTVNQNPAVSYGQSNPNQNQK